MNEVVEIKKSELALNQSSPAALMLQAVAQGMDPAVIERMMDLQDRFEKNEARKAYVAAMTEFKGESLEIFKGKMVGYKTKAGDVVGYKHAELSDVVDVIVPALARHGFSHRWDIAQNSGVITVSCVITHSLGHSEKVEMVASPDASGQKNAIQQVASAITYLKRYTLLAITGLSTKEEKDDDGEASGDKEGHLADWLAAIESAQSEQDLKKIRRDGTGSFDAQKDVTGYRKFATALTKRAGELKDQQ